MLKTRATYNYSFVFLVSIFGNIDQLAFASGNMDIPIQFLIILGWQLYFPRFLEQFFSEYLTHNRRLILI